MRAFAYPDVDSLVWTSRSTDPAVARVLGFDSDAGSVAAIDTKGVPLRVDLFRLGLHPDAYERLKQIAGSRVTGAGELLITARRFRTQEANRQDARRRLAEMIAAAHIVQRKRKPTRPTRAAKAERVDTKRKRSAVKQTRGKVQFD